MKFSKLITVEYGFLRTKLARRIFVLFILCALFPLILLAFFSISHVTNQLYEQAEQRLDNESRNSAMTTIERLTLLENDLKFVTTNLDMKRVNPLESIRFRSHDWFKHRFTGFMLLRGNDQITTALGTIHTPPPMRSEQYKHVTSGKTLVTTLANPTGNAHVYMSRMVHPDQPASAILVGEIHPAYLWRSHELSPLFIELTVVDKDMNLLYSTLSSDVSMEQFKGLMQQHASSRQFSWKHNQGEYISSFKTAFMMSHFLTNWIIINCQSTKSILDPILNFKTIYYLFILLTFLLVLFLSLTQIRKNMMPIEILQKAIRKIQAKDFTYKVEISSKDEFMELGTAFNNMTHSLKKHIDAINTINKIGIALSAEKDQDNFMKIVLMGAMKITNADAGFLYLINNSYQVNMSHVCVQSLSLEMNESIIKTNYPFYNSVGSISNEFTSSSIFNDVAINIPDIYNTRGFNFSRNFAFDKIVGYQSTSSLSVPMKNHENDLIGVLQLINAKDRLTNEIISFSDNDQEVTKNLASVAAVAMTKNRSLEDFKALFDSLVELLATAIDEKSSYAGGHSRRVPDLTIMIAEAINNADYGAFKYVNMSDNDLYALRTAAILHDCGKVSIPAHIENKMSKLQTIFDRIHLLDTRFEILKRDMEVGALKKQLSSLMQSHDAPSSDLDSDGQALYEQIEDDRNFLHACNTGRKQMDEAMLKRLRLIAEKYRWTDFEGKEKSVISDNELHYLSIPIGTITEEERAIINSHVYVSSKMLSSLHYPKTLRKVPEFAATHHERIDGSGYPKGLTRDQIPLEGRIIAVADVFEALTAKDRPYKKRYKLMKALSILGSMKEQGHIDPDLFELFIREKLYLRYAEKYLPPDQIDEIVLDEIPGYAYSSG